MLRKKNPVSPRRIHKDDFGIEIVGPVEEVLLRGPGCREVSPDGAPVVGSVDVWNDALATSPQDVCVHEVVPVVRLRGERNRGRETGEEKQGKRNRGRGGEEEK